jgi:hypothetical protein
MGEMSREKGVRVWRVGRRLRMKGERGYLAEPALCDGVPDFSGARRALRRRGTMRLPFCSSVGESVEGVGGMRGKRVRGVRGGSAAVPRRA